MKHKIFTNLFFNVMLIFAICFSISTWAMYSHFSHQSVERIENYTRQILKATEIYGQDFLRNIDTEGNESISYYCAEDVLPEEIKTAIENGDDIFYGYSPVTGEKVINYVLKLNDGGVLRVSSPDFSASGLPVKIAYYIMIIIIIAFLFSAFVAIRVSGNVVKPINNMNIKNPDERDVYRELRPLVQRINTQNVQIQQQVNELKSEHEKQNKMRREFTANVSHELKTPLTSISGYAEIMRDGLAKQEDTERFAGKIYDESQRLISLVGDIINLSRLDEGEVREQKREIDLLDVAHSVCEHLSPVAKKRGITINVSGNSAKIAGAEKIIDEIVYNLCDNAIKYNKEYGTVDIVTGTKDGKAFLSVKDTGIGIPEDEADRVFERFYRVDKSHSKEIGGTGLGLSIVKHGVSYHGGEIKLSSRLGEGTEIKIIFQGI